MKPTKLVTPEDAVVIDGKSIDVDKELGLKEEDEAPKEEKSASSQLNSETISTKSDTIKEQDTPKEEKAQK